MLEINNLHAKVAATPILHGLNLTIREGEVHALMGPNGSGKSTLAYVLAGKPGYEITDGTVLFDGEDLTALAPEERARKGLFLSFQQPIEIPGVRLDHFLRAGYNELMKSKNTDELDPLQFDRLIRARAKSIDMDANLIKRSVNEGFSGGEKKRNEVLQMAVLEPRLQILDEIDSGLDVDALREVSEGINQLRTSSASTLVVTHYERILTYLKPDFVHVLINGKIVRTGDKILAKEIEDHGYDWLNFEQVT
ncbi:MAG: Fe-S cluster assembly ATPase SufC [Chloroflexi bacterium]|mgnify:CR=1 FL=1|nr:Fe-S cluster assembly ATPase SufC [Chloroflexota bacterium]|tara:strand:- start:1349 stop:2101 length:753 start_codon:yes stop_codon:yes gene_type:complete